MSHTAASAPEGASSQLNREAERERERGVSLYGSSFVRDVLWYQCRTAEGI